MKTKYRDLYIELWRKYGKVVFIKDEFESFRKKVTEIYEEINPLIDGRALELYVYKVMVDNFKEKYGYYPKATDYTKENLLPDARTLQRKFGGLKKIRQIIQPEGETDYTKGKTRSNKALETMIRSQKYEHELYLLLQNKYNKPSQNIFVEREPVLTRPDFEINFGYKRADIAIHNYSGDEKETQFIDFFYPSNEYSFKGCVRHKYNKIKDLAYNINIIYVCVNPEFTQEKIDSFYRPKNCPPILSLDSFKHNFDV